MRFAFAGLDIGIGFDHLLHAHSHTLYFGWAGLAFVTGASAMIPALPTGLRRTLVGLASVVPAILVSFLAFGYNPVSIAVSTVVMLGWYVASVVWWRAARGLRGLPALAFRSAFVYVIVSSLGIWVLAWLQASETGTPLTESLAVNAFILGFGWSLILGTVGLVVRDFSTGGWHLDEEILRRAIVWWVALGWLVFPLGVVGGPEVAWLGPVARVAGVALLYPAGLFVRELWRAVPAGRAGRPWRFAAGWFALTAATTAGAAVLGSAALGAVGRQGVVIHLHALAVGFVTTSLVVVFSRQVPSRVLDGHNISLGLMLLGLTLVPLGAVRLGMWWAALAAVGLWVSGVVWATGLVRGR